MPQMNKGGKFIFGISIIKEDYSVIFPTQAAQEYDIASEGRVYLISGSKKTGGFVVTRKGLLFDSKIGNILNDNPALCEYALPEGTFVKYKNRKYCWCKVSEDGVLQLTPQIADEFGIGINSKLLSIRSSNIAFTMGAKGPLMQKAEDFEGEIPRY